MMHRRKHTKSVDACSGLPRPGTGNVNPDAHAIIVLIQEKLVPPSRVQKLGTLTMHSPHPHLRIAVRKHKSVNFMYIE